MTRKELERVVESMGTELFTLAKTLELIADENTPLAAVRGLARAALDKLDPLDDESA
jgi:hypothetical protein